ncbi:MAG: LacI family DNA-binding transcriptional regulator [Scardovia wiggsiae]|uniref:LacI family DNA-binding transcriptional regulator n=1 Tax=Scardovia wiggsiae TaxID=230143 RepID=UPI001CAADD0B|nr:LacI family DNA-binding transcriptional regulator [Scardovia wiggsiae]
MAYVTIRDVAQRSGTSVSTVSRALNNRGRISRETKALVEKTAHELGYIPDSRAQAMRSTRTRLVGLLVPDIRNPYFADLAYAIQDTLFDAGYCTSIGTSSEDSVKQDAYIMNMLSQHIDGAIIVPRGGKSKALKALVDISVPMVFVDRHVNDMPEVPVVDSDPSEGLLKALTDLHSRGFRKVGYISGPIVDSPTLQEREYAFRSAGRALFGEDNLFVESTSFGHVSCLSVIRKMRGSGVNAFIFGYSQDAVQAISALGYQGLAIGKDISLISFDDLEMFRLMTPNISVISQQVHVIGSLGAQLFLDIVERGRKAGSQRVETVYIPRGSVGEAR